MKSAASRWDILVVGAGPVGLAAALILDRVGYSVALVAPPRAGADERTSALLAGSVAFLERTGIWPEVAEAAAPLASLRIVDATARLIRAPEVVFHASEIGLPAFGYNLPNAALLSALDSAVEARSSIRRIAALVDDIDARDDGIAATLSSGERIEARLVVAADGRKSKIREAVGITVNEWRYDQAALVANLRHTRSHEDTSTEFHTETGPFTLVPLPGRRSSLVWVDTPGEAKRRAALSDDALAAEIEACAASMLGAMTLEGARQVFPLASMNASRFAARRAVLVGEAAHLFPPIGAQGLNLGYRDVASLGEILAGPASDPGTAARLMRYDRARRVDVFTRTAAVDALNRTLLTGFLPVQAMRGLGLFLLDRVPALRRAVMRKGVAVGS